MRALILLLALSACGDEVSLLAQSDVFANGNWQEGPRLVGDFGGHSATLLSDGSIVVLGGVSYDSTASAQVCNLQLNSCSERGSLLQHFEQHDAVLLSTAKILVAGGTWDAAAELYDPQTGNSEELARENTGAGTKLLGLRDGRVFVFNGPAKNFFFDPAAGAWSPVDPPAMSHVSATLAELEDGSILLSGDCAICPSSTPSAEIMSPSGEWRAAAAMLTKRAGHTMTVLPDGRVLVVGGADREDPIGAEVYTPATDTWIQAGDASTNRLGHVATLLDDGRVLVTGGKVQDSLETRHDPTWALFEPLTNTWTFGANLLWRQYHAAVALPGASAIVLGGDRDYMESRNE